MVLRVAIVVAVVVALIAVEASSRSGVLWRLITFTYQANVLAAAYYLWTLASPRADARVGLRGAVVLYVVIAGVIWNLFLTGYSMGYTGANILLHVVVPVLALTDWLLVGRGQGQVRWWQPHCLAGVSGCVPRAGIGRAQRSRVGARRITSSTPTASDAPQWWAIFVCSAPVCSLSATCCWRSTASRRRPASTPPETF